jgi:hypothetical protein
MVASAIAFTPKDHRGNLRSRAVYPGRKGQTRRNEKEVLLFDYNHDCKFQAANLLQRHRIAERDSQHSPADELPPVFPVDLCNVASRQFTSSLLKQNFWLKQKLKDVQIEKIEQQLRDLRIAFRENDRLQQ